MLYITHLPLMLNDIIRITHKLYLGDDLYLDRFMGMRKMSRDESTMEYAMKVLIQVLINFSMGLVMALAFFVFGLWSIVRSYQPNPLTAVAFFIGASCAAFAFVSTYLLAIYGAAAGGVYGLAKVVESNARLEQGRRRQNVGYHPHQN